MIPPGRSAPQVDDWSSRRGAGGAETPSLSVGKEISLPGRQLAWSARQSMESGPTSSRDRSAEYAPWDDRRGDACWRSTRGDRRVAGPWSARWRRWSARSASGCSPEQGQTVRVTSAISFNYSYSKLKDCRFVPLSLGLLTSLLLYSRIIVTVWFHLYLICYLPCQKLKCKLRRAERK